MHGSLVPKSEEVSTESDVPVEKKRRLSLSLKKPKVNDRLSFTTAETIKEARRVSCL